MSQQGQGDFRHPALSPKKQKQKKIIISDQAAHKTGMLKALAFSLTLFSTRVI